MSQRLPPLDRISTARTADSAGAACGRYDAQRLLGLIADPLARARVARGLLKIGVADDIDESFVARSVPARWRTAFMRGYRRAATAVCKAAMAVDRTRPNPSRSTGTRGLFVRLAPGRDDLLIVEAWVRGSLEERQHLFREGRAGLRPDVFGRAVCDAMADEYKLSKTLRKGPAAAP